MTVSGIPRSIPTGLATLMSSENIEDINLISTFLATPSSQFTAQDEPHTVYVIAGSAILPLSAAVFDQLTRLEGNVTLIIAGGIGHSTSYLYEAVSKHPIYKALADRVQGLPEAEAIHLIMLEYWPELAKREQRGDLTVLIDRKSTNCGGNAIEAKRLLDGCDIWPRRLFIIQDPTMHRRTLACFEKVYSDDPRVRIKGMPQLLPWSFIPHIRMAGDNSLSWSIRSDVASDLKEYELWDFGRFISLVIGEIPRLRDDANGYGPRGAGFITHVDIPEEIEDAWARLKVASPI